MHRLATRFIRTRRLANTVAATVVLGIVSVAAPAWTAVEHADQQFIDGLRQRRLFSLAEAFCKRQLAVPQPTATDTAHWTVELIRVYSDQAVNASGPEREAAWQRAAETAAQFEADHPDQPRGALVQVQVALALLSQGELARMEAEVGALPQQAIAQARETIREAARKLETLDEELTNLIPLADRNRRAPGAMSAAELSSLQQNVRYQWARALRNQALCYPTRSADRVAALTQSVRMLEQPLRVLPSDDPLVPRIKIDYAICQRLLGELKSVATTLSGLDGPNESATTRLLARAEQLRLLLAAGKLQAAVQALGTGRSLDGTTAPELDFAILEVYIANWRQAGNSSGTSQPNGNPAAKRWEDKSIATLEFIEQTYGPYWGRRAELLLVSVNLRAGSGNVSILDRAARDLYLKQRFNEAVVAYRKAAEAARLAGDSQQAFGLAYKATLIQQQLQHFGDAAQGFQQLALSQPANPLASNAHLLAIMNRAREAQADASLLADYAGLLKEHLQTWPTSETANTARLWQGQLQESQQQWKAAAQSFSQIALTSEHLPVAVASSLRCWSRLLAMRAAASEPTDELAKTASDYCRAVLHRQQNQLPDRWGPLDGECLLGLARLQLRYRRSDLQSLEAMLRAALANAEPPADWKTAAQAQLVLVLLGKPGGPEAAQKLLGEIGNASTAQLWQLLGGIATASKDMPHLAASIGALERDIADRLLQARPPLDAVRQLRVALVRAAALVKLGAGDEALAAYAALAKQHPTQASVQIAYAELLLSSEAPDQLQAALAQWRRVASKTKPRTPGWFRAKYSVALAQFKLGSRAEAAKLIRYLQATEDLTQSGLEREFLELLQRCQ